MPDPTTETETNPQKKCKLCQATSDDHVLLCGDYRGQPVWVCVRRLPMLIHAEH